MTTEVELRILSPDDLGALAPLVAESEAQGFRFLRRWLAEPAPLSAAAPGAAAAYFGAVVAGQVVGVGGVTPDPYLPAPDVGRLRHVYVASAVRRRGIGSLLVRTLEDFAASTYGVLRLRTDTAAAAHFYVGLGYVAVSDPTATHQRELLSRTPS